MSAMSEAEREWEHLKENHPVVTLNYLVVTPMIEKAYAIIRQRVYFRHASVLMLGSPRIGKTTCANTIKNLLRMEFKDRYSVYITIPERDKQPDFYRNFVSQEGLIARERESPDTLLDKILVHIISNLQMDGGKHFVLIVDEMQLMQIGHYEQLVALHNRLETHGIKMTTVGFAQPEILDRRQLLVKMNKKMNLVARFLSAPVRFETCTSDSTFFSILDKFDKDLEYPEGSGCSFTNFFLPQAYAAGFRISKEHENIWQQIVKVVGHFSLEVLPMENLLKIIQYLLVFAHEFDRPDFKLPPKIIEESIDASLLLEFMSVMNYEV